MKARRKRPTARKRRTGDSTRRAIRTGIHATLGLAAAVPVSVAALHLPAGQAVVTAGTVVAVATGVSKAWNALEERGLVPPWLK
ncbi:MAG: hypothetical protein ACJ74O_13390 [Frankiaceae bacterium]|jgi:hypothetical protein